MCLCQISPRSLSFTAQHSVPLASLVERGTPIADLIETLRDYAFTISLHEPVFLPTALRLDASPRQEGVQVAFREPFSITVALDSIAVEATFTEYAKGSPENIDLITRFLDLAREISHIFCRAYHRNTQENASFSFRGFSIRVDSLVDPLDAAPAASGIEVYFPLFRMPWLGKTLNTPEAMRIDELHLQCVQNKLQMNVQLKENIGTLAPSKRSFSMVFRANSPKLELADCAEVQNSAQSFVSNALSHYRTIVSSVLQ